MNKSMVRYLLSKLLLIEASLMLIPVIVAFIYHEDIRVINSLVITIGMLVIIGLLGVAFKPKNYHVYTKEGLLIVALCWILWSFFGALPFVLSGQIPSIIDAFFEMVSGFTTTGATIVPDVAVLSHSLLFWRSFAHLIGGMGVLVFALAIMENSKNSHLEVMRAEVPGPVFGKVVSKLKETAQILYVIYLSMFAILVVILMVAGMPAFDSVITAMGCAGTGGFGVYNDSIAHYNSSLITNIVSIAVLLFGINFNLYYFLLLRKFKAFLNPTRPLNCATNFSLCLFSNLHRETYSPGNCRGLSFREKKLSSIFSKKFSAFKKKYKFVRILPLRAALRREMLRLKNRPRTKAPQAEIVRTPASGASAGTPNAIGLTRAAGADTLWRQ